MNFGMLIEKLMLFTGNFLQFWFDCINNIFNLHSKNNKVLVIKLITLH